MSCDSRKLIFWRCEVIILIYSFIAKSGPGMRVLCISFVIIFCSFACADRVICPAFQSTYILDDSTRIAYYSYVWKLDEATRQQYLGSLSTQTEADSGAVGAGPSSKMGEYFAYAAQYVPARDIVKKNKFGIIKYEPNWMKKLQLRTAPMENVLGPEKEEEISVDEGEFYASDFESLDSTLTVSATLGDSLLVNDSTTVGSQLASEEVPASLAEKKEQKYRFKYDPNDNFNADQDYYNKYFGVLLLDNTPDPVPQPVDSLNVSEEEILPDSLRQEKKGIKGLFKKKGAKKDDLAPPADPEEETKEEGGN